MLESGLSTDRGHRGRTRKVWAVEFAHWFSFTFLDQQHDSEAKVFVLEAAEVWCLRNGDTSRRGRGGVL